MSRENLRPIFRWMPVWMLKAIFALSCLFVLLPFAMWDALRGALREIRQDYRDMVDATVEDDE